MKKIYLKVEGMSCQGCVNTMQNLLESIEGVRKVDIELVPGSAQLICEDTVKNNNIIDTISKKTQYRAIFDKAEEI